MNNRVPCGGLSRHRQRDGPCRQHYHPQGWAINVAQPSGRPICRGAGIPATEPKLIINSPDCDSRMVLAQCEQKILMPRPLFIVGNKRSGTSQLVRVLNLHPNIFVSHESDILWILYQFHHDQPFVGHPWDSDRGMRVTLAAAGHRLDRTATPWENFVNVQQAVMEQGTPWLPVQQKPDLRWIGDKKPMQHTDPELLKFLLAHLPDARFLHIVRHPFEVVTSSDRFNQTADGDFWQGLTPEEKLERWTFHEKQVWQLRQNFPERVHTLRFEDFCRNTQKELTNVFKFLDLKPDARLLGEADRQTRPLFHPIAPLAGSPETLRVAASYGYDLQRPEGRVRRWLQKIYWRIKKTGH